MGRKAATVAGDRKDLRSGSNPTTKKLMAPGAVVEHSDVNGKGAWKITTEDKRTTVWTTDDGKWDLLKVQGVKMTQRVGSEDLSTFEFSGPNPPVTVTKPTDVVKMSDLMPGK